MKRVGVVCASGIGDALIMMIGARHLRALGNEVCVFSDHLPALSEWFPGFSFLAQPAPGQISSSFQSFDALLLQHDNSFKAKAIRSLELPVYSLFGAHAETKHGALRRGFDFVFEQGKCMADNLVSACGELFPGVDPSRENGLAIPEGLTFRKHLRRIAIHPTSSSAAKNWPKSRFLAIKKRLEESGFEPVFTVRSDESTEWGAPPISSLGDLAAFLYESGGFIGNDSGPGHLASCLGLQTLIIGESEEHLSFWRPGWSPCAQVSPPKVFQKMKLSREKWMYFISVDHVFKSFTKLYIN